MTNKTIIGVDEVGRGCIAGDLVVCAYAFNPKAKPENLSEARGLASDSKSFSTRARREAGISRLRAAGIFFFARRTPEEIDRMNIRAATLAAMREAAEAVRENLGFQAPVIVDGRDIPEGLEEPVESCIKGDAKIPEIAAASMLAKVARDLEMVTLAESHPGYGFETHAGYGTAAHRAAIARLGLSPIHRSWARKFASP
jgi:ribonuclease HII